ncbi:MAG TPA: HlyD family secretion protein [Hyphomicrobiaceae bacterium]|nr:HlyD family secretion protein [Hyphomicrobiaceae bacterium]
MLQDQELREDQRDRDGDADLIERRPIAQTRPPAAPAGTGAKRKIVRLAGVIVALAALAGGAMWGQYWWTQGRYLVSTDDAYVGARNATLSPKVSGYITEIAVEDNAQVTAGDVIVRIDDGDYRLAVANARDQIAVQQATVDRLGRQTAAQVAAVEQAKAQLSSAKAGETRSQLELRRQQDLATRQINSRQALEQAQANWEQAAAAVQSAEAAITAATANVDVLKAQQEEARRTLQQYQTALQKAERDLSFTVIKAPFDGVIGNRAVQVGDYVQPTQRLASLVPLDAVYIDANFKETQLARLKPGQPVSIKVDALPDRSLEGRVASVAPASGSVFSLLPPDNATGNFTKIVQRLPVRILLPADVTEQSLLRPGMSVIVSVNTKPDAPVPAQRMGSATVRSNSN